MLFLAFHVVHASLFRHCHIAIPSQGAAEVDTNQKIQLSSRISPDSECQTTSEGRDVHFGGGGRPQVVAVSTRLKAVATLSVTTNLPPCQMIGFAKRVFGGCFWWKYVQNSFLPWPETGMRA